MTVAMTVSVAMAMSVAWTIAINGSAIIWAIVRLDRRPEVQADTRAIGRNTIVGLLNVVVTGTASVKRLLVTLG